MNNLGHLYSSGLGVEINYQEAIKWYEKASHKGYGLADIHRFVLVHGLLSLTPTTYCALRK